MHVSLSVVLVDAKQVSTLLKAELLILLIINLHYDILKQMLRFYIRQTKKFNVFLIYKIMTDNDFIRDE